MAKRYGLHSPKEIIGVVDGAICSVCERRIGGPVWGVTVCAECVKAGKGLSDVKKKGAN